MVRSGLHTIRRFANMLRLHSWPIGWPWTLSCFTFMPLEFWFAIHAQKLQLTVRNLWAGQSLISCISWNKGRCMAPYATFCYHHPCSMYSGADQALPCSSWAKHKFQTDHGDHLLWLQFPHLTPNPTISNIQRSVDTLVHYELTLLHSFLS